MGKYLERVKDSLFLWLLYAPFLFISLSLVALALAIAWAEKRVEARDRGRSSE